jgi:hypothetical protein
MQMVQTKKNTDGQNRRNVKKTQTGQNKRQAEKENHEGEV